ncbi:MAG: hypothetical protein IAF02_19640 [Anaerolineae bacterium]|nr:hypothetical protein [Anaerolineae bacterium]
MRYFILVLIFFVLLLGVVFEMAMAQDGVTAVTPPPSPAPQSTPTVDRLAPPPTAETPTQLDEGAYLYWLYCIPCHGDKGQGLTDEWRMQYPEEDRYCWNSTCHGSNPPQPYGFQIPTVVPPIVIPHGGLERFDTLGEVYYYTRGSMPLELPGRLTDEEYLAIMAFLANEMGIWEGQDYSAQNILGVRLRPDEVIAVESTATVAPVNTPKNVTTISSDLLGLVALAFGAVVVIGGVFVWRRQNR